jgi:hypothetical protein
MEEEEERRHASCQPTSWRPSSLVSPSAERTPSLMCGGAPGQRSLACCAGPSPPTTPKRLGLPLTGVSRAAVPI